MKAQVVGMFKWDDKTLKILANKKLVRDPSLLEKQHRRIVCYFFEKLFDLMMGLNHNFSSNAGSETSMACCTIEINISDMFVFICFIYFTFIYY